MINALFTGYAPVHYLCFRPLHRGLLARGDVTVTLSGGLRRREGDDTEYDTLGLYRPLGVDEATIATVDQIAERDDFDVVFAANTKLIAPRRAGLSLQLFHGLSFRNRGIRPEVLRFDRLFLLGPYMRRRFLELGLLRGDDDRKGVPIGFAKTDALLDGSLDRAETLARLGLSGDRPVVLYAPTGQQNNSLDRMGEALIEALDGNDSVEVLLKLHDHPKRGTTDWATRLAGQPTSRLHLVQDLDVIPLCHAADLLITDASSVANEYALLDRPILFLDVPELIERASQLADSAQDLDSWGRQGGQVLERVDQVLPAIEEALAHPERRAEVRQAIARDLFFNPGRATEAALAWLDERFP